MGLFGLFGNDNKEVNEIEPGNEANVAEDELPEIAKDMLTELLDLMGFLNVVKIIEGDEDSVSLEIKGDDIGRIIGKEGNTLFSLQTLIRNALNRKFKRSVNVVLDANNYRQKRERTIKELAIEAEAKAIEKQKEVLLKPMNPWERRLVHMELQDKDTVKTESRGRGKDRQVVVLPM